MGKERGKEKKREKECMSVSCFSFFPAYGSCKTGT